MEPEKRLRRASTDAERKLWPHLRSAQLGEKFRRQHEILGYIVDFVSIERRLIVELDGGQHADQQEYDEKRTACFNALGFGVLHFWNNDVLHDTERVLAAIVAALAQTPSPHPNPLPRLHRGRGSRAAIAQSGAHSETYRSETDQLETDHSEKDQSKKNQSKKDDSEKDQSEMDESETEQSSDTEDANTPLRSNHDAGIRTALEQRARLYALIREFFATRNVLEVETPILSAGANTDPNIQSFSTEFSGHLDAGACRRWLRTSSEFAQKRLLAAGVGDNYELGRVFRNGEAGRRHNPEFTMLEWYRVGWDHRRLIDEAVQLVDAALQLVGRRAHLMQTSYRDLFVAACGLEPFGADDAELRAVLRDVQIDAQGLTRDDWLDLILTHTIQPAFPADRITVIYDYPASQCALARIRDGDPPVAERFEIYVGVHELANGYHELTDAQIQRQRFERDNVRRRKRGEAPLPLDERLLTALRDGMPACAGVALGIERLLMAMAGSDDIRDVLAFSFAQA